MATIACHVRGQNRRRQVHRAARIFLAAGNLGFGLIAMVDGRRVSRWVSDLDEAEVVAAARRDLGVGLALATARDPLWPLLRGLRSDIVEAVTWVRRKPRLAIVPIAWVVLGIVAILTRD